jgi:opacity protein-like surface antigen
LSAVSDRAEFQVAASYDVKRYQDHDELNEVDNFYQVLASFEATPRLSFALVGTYVIDYTFWYALEVEGVRANRNQRHVADARPSMRYKLGPRDSIEIACTPYMVEYHRSTRRDYKGNDVNLGWIHDLQNERTTFELLIGADQTDYDDDEDNPDEKIRDRTLRTSASVQHKLSETTTVEGSAGVRFTDSRVYDGGSSTDQSAGFLGHFLLTQTFERATVSASLNRSYSPSTFGEGATRDSARLSAGYRLTERLGCSVGTAIRQSKSERVGAEDRKSRTFSVTPGVTYRLTESVRLALGYSFYRVDHQDTGDTDDQNRVWLGLTWNILEPEWRIRSPRPLVEWPYRY